MMDRFAHRLKLDQIRQSERVDLRADGDERRAIAERLGLVSLERLEAHVTLKCNARVIRVEGRIVASLEQTCVITGDLVPAHVDEPFTLIFVPEPETSNPAEEIELGEGDCDIIFYDGSAIDLGSAIADTLALDLDPYPRSAAANATLKEVGIMTEEQASPFAALASLKGGGTQKD